MMTAQESKLQEFTTDLRSESGGKNCFRIAREGRDVISVCCMKSDADNLKDIYIAQSVTSSEWLGVRSSLRVKS